MGARRDPRTRASGQGSAFAGTRALEGQLLRGRLSAIARAAMISNGSQPIGDSTSGEVMFGLHAVAMIDFLGQTQQLARWDFIPNTPAQVAEWIQGARATIGRIMTWRQYFEKGFQKFTSFQLPTRLLAALSPEQQAEFAKMRETAIQVAHFSDSIIVYSPLQNQHNYWQVGNLYAIIVSCGTLLAAALTAHVALRGGLDIGMLARFPSGDPYGPGLAKAYCLESNDARYPRVVVGPGVFSYLDAIEREPGDTPPVRANRDHAADCRRCLTQDSDGKWIIDYLNDHFANLGGDPVSFGRLRDMGFAFVQSERERFQRENDTKLADRYCQLERYFKTHGA